MNTAIIMDNAKRSLSIAKEKSLDYLGFCSNNDDLIERALRAITARNGIEVLEDECLLRQELYSENIPNIDVNKIAILTRVTGFKELISRNQHTVQNDINRFARNATNESGINSGEVLRLTSCILSALGIATKYNKIAQDIKTDKNTSFVVPSSFYEKELSEFEYFFEKTPNAKSVDFKNLEPLVAAGIPRAKAIMGYCLLNNADNGDPQAGLELLTEAANESDTEAAAALGDYYFNQNNADGWATAYEYYTGYGSLALNERRKENIVKILNRKRYNQVTILLSSFLFAAILLTVIFAPGIPLFLPKIAIGVLSLIADGVLLVSSIIRFKNRPYCAFNHIPICMFCIWAFYMAIRTL